MGFESFGLSELVAKPEEALRLCALAMAEGQRVPGYGGDYYRLLLGDAVAVVRTMADPETGEEQLLGVDPHAVTGCRWRCRVVRDVTGDAADPLSRRLLVQTPGCGDTAVVDVVCADVVPDLSGELTLGMAAFPLRLDYSGGPCRPVVEAQEDTVLLQGTVKDVKVGKTYLGMEPLTQFISATVSTSMGDVELCHLAEMVREEQKDLVKVGATVSALCRLSGDAAVGEYAGGVVFSEEKDLALLGKVLRCGDVHRLRPAMRSDCGAVFLENRQEGVENALSLLETVGEQLREAGFCRCVPGIVVGVEDGGETPPPCAPGRRCLLLGQEGAGGFAFLCLADTDSLGRLRCVTITNDSRCDCEPAET